MRYDFAFQDLFVCRIWLRHFGLALNRFRYLYDRLFLFCCCLYAANRWGLKPRVHSAFLHDHFNDVLLIPCALPPLLLAQRWLKLRATDEPPSVGEICLNLVIWSLLFEVIGPHLMRHVIGDPWDVVSYWVGGFLAGLWWHRGKLLHIFAPHEL